MIIYCISVYLMYYMYIPRHLEVADNVACSHKDCTAMGDPGASC